MTAIPVRWRTKHKGLPPRPIKLRIPGWSGHDHGDGGESECRASIGDRGLDVQGDFDEELDPSSGHPPFDTYRVLQSTLPRRGHEGVQEVLTKAIKAWLPRQAGKANPEAGAPAEEDWAR